MSAQPDARRDKPPRLVVAIGASAGGLDACRNLLAATPPQNGMAFVIIMHLDPGRASHLTEIFAAATKMEVSQVTEPQPLAADRVYVIAPDTSLELRDGILSPAKPAAPHGMRKPVDALFASLAEDQRELAVAIVLSGTGNDGSVGIRDIKARGGLCLAQDPQTAEYDGMPRHAIATSVIDEVLVPEKMPEALLRYAEHPGGASPGPDGERPPAFEHILELLGRACGVNFRSLYKRGTLERRAARRMELKRVPDWQTYLETLEADDKEVAALYRDLLIDVTQFFRDPEVWDQLAKEIVPRLVRLHDDGTPIKVWVPGCASGEEAYSLTMLLLEQLDRASQTPRLQVFATDVADEPLAFARQGRYPSTTEEAIAPERLSRFFRREGGELQVSRELREAVTFAVHNLLTDPPFSGLDLVSCRNVLIYLEPPAQERVLDSFHFGLRPGGFLLLGASETTGARRNLFEAVSEKARIYRRVAVREAAHYHHLHLPAERPALRGLAQPPVTETRGPRISRAIEQMVLGRYTAACVAVTDFFEIQSFFGPTQHYLMQPTGEARMDLLAWARPGMYPRLRAGLEKAREHNERVVVSGLHVQRDDEDYQVECTIEPITPLPSEARMFLVSFRDVPQPPSNQQEPYVGSEAPLMHQLESELRGTREELQSVIGQLESTNEAYRAGHEELLSLNEELQSNNEELEASKEELQSLNEELVTVNRQLEEKNRALRALSTDINNLLVSSGVPIIFLDRSLRIRRFTPAATELMRLVPTDVGRSVEHVKERFHDERLVGDAQSVLDKLVPVRAEVQTEDGRFYVRHILPYRTEDDRIDGVCISFNDITDQTRAAGQIEEARIYAEAIVATIRAPLLVLDPEMRVVTANHFFLDTFRVSRSEIEGSLLHDLGNHQWDVPALRDLLENILPARGEVRDFRVEREFETIGRRVMLLNARQMRSVSRQLILLSIEDITAKEGAEQLRTERVDELVLDHRRKDEYLAMLGHELRNPIGALSHGLSILELSGDDASRRQQVRDMMARQVKRITDMLEQLLDIARLSGGKIQMARLPVDLVEATLAGVDSALPLIEVHRHELSRSLPAARSVLVMGDATRLAQVVENLLSNAAKYTEEGGKVWLSLEADETSARLRVRDTGSGIEAEFLPQIFEPFSQAPRTLERAAGGLGLGLPLVKRVVEMHGGKVEASSPGLGRGSEFVVTLPRLLERRSPTRTPREAEKQPESRPRRILVIDDDRDCAHGLAEVLSLRGHEVHVALDGPAALDAARTFRPEVVLLDLGLPQMDGYVVAQRLREEHTAEEMLLVAVTGYQADAERLTRAGFDRHLIKPVDMQKLLAWIAASHERE